jgi:enterochelin esterase-like enzyme
MQPSVGSIDTYHNFKSDYVAPRRISVWLPEGYAQRVANGERFGTLYMHDGQMLFDASTTWNGQEWRIDESSQALLDAGKVRPFIVIGMDNGGDALRYVEYMPQQPFAALPSELQQSIYARQSHSNLVQSDNYLQFIVAELKPFIDHQYATLTGPADTFLAGASMGGLISWYGVARHPEVFGGCLCISTHIIGGFDMQETRIFEAFVAYMAEHLPLSGSHVLYFDYGDQTLDQYYPPLHDKLAAFFSEAGADSKQVTVNFFPGMDHSETAWQQRFPNAVIRVFGQSTKR